MLSLSRNERKALALHVWLAERLRNDPRLVAVVKRRIALLMRMNPAGTPYYRDWAVLLDGPFEVLLDAMVSPSEKGCALRQESPFVDLVDQRERARIFREVSSEGHVRR